MDCSALPAVLLLGLLMSLLAFACTAEHATLTDVEKQKLDPCLQSLVQGTPRCKQYDTYTREDGTLLYGVIIRSDDADALRDAGLTLGSVLGSIITARLTVEDIRKAAGLEAVRAIENPGTASFQK